MRLLVILVAIWVGVMAAPIPPPLSATFEYEYVELLTSDAVELACTTAQDGPGGRYVNQCNTTAGYYKQLYRFDLNISVLAYEQEGEAVCWVSEAVHPGPLPAPDYASMTWVQRVPGAGGDMDVFRLPLGRYAQTLMVDVATQLPAVMLTGNMDDVRTMVVRYSNGSATPSLFDVPAGCGAPSRATWRPAIAGTPAAVHLPPAHPVRRAHSAAHPWEAKMAARTREWPLELSLAVPPLHVDNRRFFNPVRNQGMCGACYSFASASIAEMFVNMASNTTWVENDTRWLAPQYIIDCVTVRDPSPHDQVPKGCFGGDPIDVFNFIGVHGIATEASYPYSGGMGSQCKAETSELVFPVSRGFLLPANVTAMRVAIDRYGAIVAPINDPVSWSYFGGHGVYNDPSCTPGVAHIITIVGYGHDDDSGLDYWLVRNSFGAGWADAGYIKMAAGVNMCGIETYPMAAVPRSA